jgi:ammonia channel protein AmtB
METMLPVMTTGLVAGMVVSMSAAMGSVSMIAAVEYGALSGLGVMVATYLLNAIVKPRASKWTT